MRVRNRLLAFVVFGCGLAVSVTAVRSHRALAQPVPGAADIDEDTNDEGAESVTDGGSSDAALVVVALVDGAVPLARGVGVEVPASILIDGVRGATQPLLQQYAASPELVQSLADRLVADRLLSAEARRRGLDRDPLVQAAIERALVARFRATVIDPAAGTVSDVTDVDSRRWYDAHTERFHLPERRRARGIFLSTRSEAEAVLRLARARRRGRYVHDFRRLAATRNADPELAGRRGELRELTLGEWLRCPPVSVSVRSAVFSAEPGEVLPRVVEGTWRGRPGYWVLRYLTRRAAIDRSFEDSREWIRARIVLERRVALERLEVDRLSSLSRVVRRPASNIVRIEPGDAGPSP